AAFDAGGLEVLNADLAAFSRRLKSENHTLKRALTDPRLFSGIGNAYSDEILHRAKLSPVAMTSALSDAQVARLFEAPGETPADWIARLRRETGGEVAGQGTAPRGGKGRPGQEGAAAAGRGGAVQRCGVSS